MTEIKNNSRNKLELVRIQVRENINYIRKQQRNVTINKKRLVFKEDNKYNPEAFIIKTATKFKQKSISIQHYRNLQNLFIENKNHIKVFFKVNNVIQGLCRDLSTRCIQSKLAAVSCCCNLALGNSKICIILCKFVSPYLIVNLESTNSNVIEISVWTIGNLVNQNTKVFTILHSQGCIKLLISLMQNSSNKLLPAVSYTCLRYIYTGADLIKISDIFIIGNIIKIQNPIIPDIETIWLLALLSSQPEYNKEIIKLKLNKVIFTICNYFFQAIITEDQNIQKITATLRIICNTISESSGKVAFYLFNNEIEKNFVFLNKLLLHQYTHIRQHALWMLGNLYNHCLDSVQKMVKAMVLSLSCLELAINSIN